MAPAATQIPGDRLGCGSGTLLGLDDSEYFIRVNWYRLKQATIWAWHNCRILIV